MALYTVPRSVPCSGGVSGRMNTSTAFPTVASAVRAATGPPAAAAPRQLATATRRSARVDWKDRRRVKSADTRASGSRDPEVSAVTVEHEDSLAVSQGSRLPASEGDGSWAAQPPAAVPELAATVVSVSGGLMVLWCLAPFPGSVWAGIPAHDSFVHLLWETFHLEAIVGPESLMLKYNTLGNAPALLHALPGAVWCALAPIQLTGPSSGPGRRVHTVGGRVMLTSAAVLMLGYALIDGSGLTAEEFDFGGDGGRLAEMIDGSALGSLMPLSFHKMGLKVIAAWFVWTGAKTMTSARGGQVAAHRAWAIRHLGAGLWVAAQRPLFSVYRLAQFALLGQGPSSVAGEQADAFYNSAYAVTLLYFLGSEAIARGKWKNQDTTS